MSVALGAKPWLRPIGLSDPDQAGWTRLGTLDGSGEPLVDRRGVVQVAPDKPGIAWWIAGDDRWYFPEREGAVRQALLKGTPVVETRVRVKGGDICHRSYAVTLAETAGFREAVVIEVENTSGVPCGIAFAVRPFGVFDEVDVRRIELVGSVVRVDGEPVIVLPRAPAGALAGGANEGDLVERVARGEATSRTFEPLECPSGKAQCTVVVPIAHRSSIRVLVPIPPSNGFTSNEVGEITSAVPSADQVVRGWQSQLADCARANVPDPRLSAVLAASPAWLLATTSAPSSPIGRSGWDLERSPRWDHVAAIAGALDRFGLFDRSAMLLAEAAMAWSEGSTTDAGWLVEAFAHHVERQSDDVFARAIAETCSWIVAPLLTRRARNLDACRRAEVLRAAGCVFARAGHKRAASTVRGALARISDEHQRVTVGTSRLEVLHHAIDLVAAGQAGDAFGVLDTHLDQAAPTVVWSGDDHASNDAHCVGVGAAVASLALELLARTDNKNCHFLAHFPAEWRGASCEVSQVATPLGRLGYAVRWHDRRPALLWELSPTNGTASTEPTVDAIGLDPQWRGVGASGEALLAEVDGPGFSAKAGARISGLSIGPSPRSKEVAP